MKYYLGNFDESPQIIATWQHCEMKENRYLHARYAREFSFARHPDGEVSEMQICDIPAPPQPLNDLVVLWPTHQGQGVQFVHQLRL